MKSRSIYINNAFTLIETLIVLSIITVLASVGIIVGVSSYQRTVFQDYQQEVIDLLHRARSRAMSGIAGTDHGVHFEPHQAILFRGISFAARDPVFDEPVELGSAITATPPGEIIFSRITGNVGSPGTVTLTDETHTMHIEITSEGGITW